MKVLQGSRCVPADVLAQALEAQEIAQSAGAPSEPRQAAAIEAKNAALLSGEFSEFIAAAGRLESSYRSLQDEVSVLGRELSERNAALQTSLAENEQMRLALQQIVDSMPCGILVLDGAGEITMINPECRRLLGIERREPNDAPRATLHRISERSGINLEGLYLSAAKSDDSVEFCVQDGVAKRWIEMRNRQLFHQAGGQERADQTILILRDVTAQKRAAQEREAGRKAMALAELTTVLAHEIRNPLASLELFAELIEKDTEQRDEWISNLRAGIRSLAGTVNNVLSFHGSGALELVSIDLTAVIGRAVQFARPLADQAAVALNWVADASQARVMGNESAIQQVVLNLISNAIRHTPAGGTVAVTLEEAAADRIRVVFTDTGSGIRADQIERIFEPGFSGSGDSSGLGLAVCERIMTQHGGRISVCNRATSGAQFTLDFPAIRMELATA